MNIANGIKMVGSEAFEIAKELSFGVGMIGLIVSIFGYGLNYMGASELNHVITAVVCVIIMAIVGALYFITAETDEFLSMIATYCLTMLLITFTSSSAGYAIVLTAIYCVCALSCIAFDLTYRKMVTYY